MTDTIMFYGMILRNVHPWQQCQMSLVEGNYQPKPRDCVIHNPSYHHMHSWYIVWRDDRKIFERLCRHGYAHPDPDQFDFWRQRGSMYESLHNCDGCCRPPFPGDLDEEAKWSIWPTRSTGTATTVNASAGSTWEPASTVANPKRIAA
jgi:hypothetical protein